MGIPFKKSLKKNSCLVKKINQKGEEKMVDNGSIIYTSNIDIVHIINHTKNFFKDEFLENEKEKIFLRNIKKKIRIYKLSVNLKI